MKKPLMVALIASTVALSSCEELAELCNIDEESLGFTEDYSKHFNSAVYIYQQADRAMRSTDLANNGVDTIDGALCSITADSIFMDYDALALGQKEGSIRLGYTGDYLVSGSTVGVRLKDYKDGDENYIGSLDILNTSVGNTPTFDIAIPLFVAGDLEFNGSMKASWNAGFETDKIEDDIFTIGGNADMIDNLSTVSYNGTILNPIEISGACAFTFVSGSLSITPSDPDLPFVTLDFIDGDCQNVFLATVDCDGNTLSFNYPIK